MIAATVSVKTPAPGLRMISGPSTAGISHTPKTSALTGGKAVKALSKATHS